MIPNEYQYHIYEQVNAVPCEDIQAEKWNYGNDARTFHSTGLISVVCALMKVKLTKNIYAGYFFGHVEMRQGRCNVLNRR